MCPDVKFHRVTAMESRKISVFDSNYHQHVQISLIEHSTYITFDEQYTDDNNRYLSYLFTHRSVTAGKVNYLIKSVEFFLVLLYKYSVLKYAERYWEIKTEQFTKYFY